MAKTNAERQAAFKAKRKDENWKQLCVWVSGELYLEIKKISDEHNLTMSEALERLVSK